MDIIAISDTHLIAQSALTPALEELAAQYPDAVLVHAGDALSHGSDVEAVQFLDWFARLPYKHKIFVPGNHDFCFDATNRKYATVSPRDIATAYPSVTVLINDIMLICVLKYVIP